MARRRQEERPDGRVRPAGGGFSDNAAAAGKTARGGAARAPREGGRPVAATKVAAAARAHALAHARRGGDAAQPAADRRGVGGARGPRRLRGEARRELGGRQVDGAPRLLGRDAQRRRVHARRKGGADRRAPARPRRDAAPASPASTTARSSAACVPRSSTASTSWPRPLCSASRRRCSSAPLEVRARLPCSRARRLPARRVSLRRRRPTTRSSAATLRGRSWARRSTAATAASRASARCAGRPPRRRDVKLGRLGTLTNVHLCGGRSPADAVAERERRARAQSHAPRRSGPPPAAAASTRCSTAQTLRRSGRVRRRGRARCPPACVGARAR